MKKKLVVLTLCGMMATSALAGCMTMQTFAAETGDEPMVISYLEGQDDQIPNPWQDSKTLKEVADATGFSIKRPKKITGYKRSAIQAVDQEILQVYYEKGEEEILIRKAVISQGKDISGDCNKYDVTKKVAVKGKKGKVTVKGSDKKKYVAIWNDGTYSYSVSTSNGMSKNALLKIVKQVQ